MSKRQVRIIDALKNLVVNRRGTDFQHLATQLAKRRFPELVASEPTADLGSDAHLLGFLTINGEHVAVAASLTATYAKIKKDCATIAEKQGGVDRVLFYTPVAKTRKTIKTWSEKLNSEVGVELEVIEQTDIVETLRQPDATSLCREYLDLDFREDPSLDELRKKLLRASRTA